MRRRSCSLLAAFLLVAVSTSSTALAAKPVAVKSTASLPCNILNCKQCEPLGNKVLCAVCAPGYVPANNKLSCTACAAGTYWQNGTTPKCTPCAKGYTTVGAGTTSADACSVCAAGYGGVTKTVRATKTTYETKTVCERCKQDTFSLGGSLAACSACGCAAPPPCQTYSGCKATTGKCLYANSTDGTNCMLTSLVPGLCRTGSCCKTCAASFAPDACGTLLDDGCGGTLECACSAADGKHCNATTANTAGTCVEINACDSFPCGPGATCTDVAGGPDSAEGRTCSCDAAGSVYANDTAGCVIEINACDGFPCHSTATGCVDIAGGPNSTEGRACSCEVGLAYDDSHGCAVFTFEDLPAGGVPYGYRGLKTWGLFAKDGGAATGGMVAAFAEGAAAIQRVDQQPFSLLSFYASLQGSTADGELRVVGQRANGQYAPTFSQLMATGVTYFLEPRLSDVTVVNILVSAAGFLDNVTLVVGS